MMIGIYIDEEEEEEEEGKKKEDDMDDDDDDVDIARFCLALLRTPTYALLAHYFDKMYPLASGVCYACGSLGLMVFAPLTQLLLSTYGWRGTLLILAAINFHLVACAALLRSPPVESNDDTYEVFSWMSDGPSESFKRKTHKLLELSGMSLFKNPSFLAVCIMTASIDTTFTGWVVYFVPHCLVKGLTPYAAAFLATAAGFVNLIGHVLYIPIVSARGAIYISGTVAAVSLLVDKFTVTIITISIANVLYMFAIGIAYPLCDVVMKSVVDPNMLATAFGWRMAIGGLVRFFPGFILGWIYDYTGSYDAGFFFLGAVQAFGVIALVVDDLFYLRK
ncbi:monocarboxylate transporter 13-like [Amphiura filiformis]|uniref:monocarboxylate transporter 13-like n=1 Tax=Amphiura filiformis TaxID=82378 RepID=UPI003B225FD7